MTYRFYRKIVQTETSGNKTNMLQACSIFLSSTVSECGSANF